MSNVLHAPNLKHYITGTQNSTKYALDVNIANATVPISGVPGFVAVALLNYTNFTVDYPSTTQEVYEFKDSGASTLATLTLNYTDLTKAFLTDGTWTVP